MSGLIATLRLAACLAFAALCPGTSYGQGAPANCGDAHTRQIPPRDATANAASRLLGRLRRASSAERDRALGIELRGGNLPGFLRRTVPVFMSGELAGGRSVEITLCVLPDYLAIGSDDDFVIAPLTLGTALGVARQYGFLLPTAKIVDAIYRQATVRLRPRPLPASDAMRSAEYVWHHQSLVREQALQLGAQPGALTAGHKKDLVLTDRLRETPGRVAIYGWHRDERNPIQPLSIVHEAQYADYSHGVRLVSATAYVDGVGRSVLDLLADPVLAPMLSHEGPLARESVIPSVR